MDGGADRATDGRFRLTPRGDTPATRAVPPSLVERRSSIRGADPNLGRDVTFPAARVADRDESGRSSHQVVADARGRRGARPRRATLASPDDRALIAVAERDVVPTIPNDVVQPRSQWLGAEAGG